MRRSKKTTDFTAGLVGAQCASLDAAASDAMREGMDKFQQAAKSNLDNSKLKGKLFEYIEAAKFNTDAASKGAGVKSHVMAAEGQHKTKHDIEFRKSGKVVGKAQLKAHKNPTDAKRALQDRQYDGMKKQTVKDHEMKISDASGEMKQGEVSSGGTTHNELMCATNGPKAYAARKELGQVLDEASSAGKAAAAAGAIMGGSVSAIRNLYAYSKGHKDGEQAALDIARDTGESAARSGAAGSLGAVIRHVGSKAGIKALTKSNIATAVASGIIDAGATVLKFAKGENSAEDTALRLGDTGCGALSGIYGGAAAGAIFGPPGAIVGSIVGYMLSTSVYQSCIVILQETRLAEEEADRVVALCDEAVRSMDRQRSEFEAKFAIYMEVRQATFDGYFEKVDSALASNDPDKAVRALSGLARSFGKKFKFVEFGEFQKFMIESKEPLEL